MVSIKVPIYAHLSESSVKKVKSYHRMFLMTKYFQGVFRQDSVIGPGGAGRGLTVTIAPSVLPGLYRLRACQ
jgi:hypothetical protein